MKISIIAAVGKNLELGKNNKLIWNLKEDLKYFKEMTMGKTVVMGEKTYYSIGKALPGRKNIVLSFDDINLNDAKVCNNYMEIFSLVEEEIFVIGGASIYKLFLPYADKLYLTEIDDEDSSADCYFPVFNKDSYEKKVIKKECENDINYSFVCYEKVK